MSIIDQIRDKTDILDLMQKEGIQLKKHGKLWKGLCPFHTEKTPSFVVYPATGTWRCYGACGSSGDVLDFYQRRHNVDLKDAIDALAKRAGIERTHQQSSKQLERLYGVLSVAADTFNRLLWLPQGKAALDYLHRRGITGDDVTYWYLGYAPQGNALFKYLSQLGYQPPLLEAAGLIYNKDGKWLDRFRNRLMFPIHDERGRVVGFGARAINDNDQPKYINSPETILFKKAELLYGMHRAKDAIRNLHEAIVVEGYTDVISAHRAGHSHVIAAMGTALTAPQLQQLRYAERVILALDNDKAGKEAIIRGVQHAGALQADMRVALFPDGMDADDTLQSGCWEACMSHTIPVTRYLIQRALATLPDDASNVEKVKLAGKLLPLLMAAENNLFQKASVQELALELGLDYHILMQHAQPPKLPVSQPPPTRTSPTIEMTLLATLIDHPDWLNEIEADLAFIDKPLSASDFKQLHHIWKLIVEAREKKVDIHDYIHSMGSDILPDCETLEQHRLWRQILNLRLRYLTAQIDIALAIHDSERYSLLQKRRIAVLREFRRGKSTIL